MTFDRYDVVVVPFPFGERAFTKRRPALVLSGSKFILETGNIVLAMITTAMHSDWPGDCVIIDDEAAGLPKASKVRMKLFTLDRILIDKHIGHLADDDAMNVRLAISETIGS